MSIDRSYYLKKGLELRAAGSTIEDILQFLRSEQASMIDSVVLIRQIENLSLRKAQKIVHLSETWADEKECHERLQEVFWDTLEDLAGEEKGSNENE
jgi:hypothetical protein